MGLMSGVLDFLGGSTAGKVVDAVAGYFPPSMSESEKANLKLAVDREVREHDRQAAELARQEAQDFNRRISDLEGTASDLKAVPFIGPVVLFLRGVQRPAWGFGALYLNAMVLSGHWTLATPAMENGYNAITWLVLGFLFGERAIKNVMPFVATAISAAKKPQ